MQINCEDAILTAIDLIEGLREMDQADGETDGEKNKSEVIKTLIDIVNQKGCEHFDPAITSGKLTELMDLCIYG